MGIKYPIVTEIAYQTYGINEFGLDDIYLLVGSEKALLIDTGTGVFDIPALLGTLTDKPVIVAATHWHFDHVGGMYYFPEMLIHPDDMDMVKYVRRDMRRGFAEVMMNARPGMYDLNLDNMIEGPVPKLLPIREGDVIHLGDRDIEVYETPGHTPGGISFLDRREKIIFTGDACNTNTLLAMGEQYEYRPKSGISDLLATARKIEGLHGVWNRHYNGHIGGETRTDFRPLPEGLAKECIKACEGLLAGTITGEPEGGHLVLNYGSVSIKYYQEQVR